MSLHMDMNARRVASFPSDIQQRIAGVAKTHSALGRPEGIGRSVAMPSKR
jgi:acyl-CoA thioester hydrolase